jgi:hypothetical protein
MADIRFQFILNGKPLCIAGAEGFGVFSSCITWVRRNGDQYEAEKQERSATWATTKEEWSRESLGVTAGTRDTKYPDYASWFDRELNAGDELTIRILGPGDCDSPKSTQQNDNEED